MFWNYYISLLNMNGPVKLFYRYSLRGDTLLNLVLIYAALIELTQKSEDFEVKVIFLVTNSFLIFTAWYF